MPILLPHLSAKPSCSAISGVSMSPAVVLGSRRNRTKEELLAHLKGNVSRSVPLRINSVGIISVSVPQTWCCYYRARCHVAYINSDFVFRVILACGDSAVFFCIIDSLMNVILLQRFPPGTAEPCRSTCCPFSVFSLSEHLVVITSSSHQCHAPSWMAILLEKPNWWMK